MAKSKKAKSNKNIIDHEYKLFINALIKSFNNAFKRVDGDGFTDITPKNSPEILVKLKETNILFPAYKNEKQKTFSKKNIELAYAYFCKRYRSTFPSQYNEKLINDYLKNVYNQQFLEFERAALKDGFQINNKDNTSLTCLYKGVDIVFTLVPKGQLFEITCPVNKSFNVSISKQKVIKHLKSILIDYLEKNVRSGKIDQQVDAYNEIKEKVASLSYIVLSAVKSSKDKSDLHGRIMEGPFIFELNKKKMVIINPFEGTKIEKLLDYEIIKSHIDDMWDIQSNLLKPYRATYCFKKALERENIKITWNKTDTYINLYDSILEKSLGRINKNGHITFGNFKYDISLSNYNKIVKEFGKYYDSIYHKQQEEEYNKINSPKELRKLQKSFPNVDIKILDKASKRFDVFIGGSNQIVYAYKNKVILQDPWSKEKRNTILDFNEIANYIKSVLATYDSLYEPILCTGQLLNYFKNKGFIIHTNEAGKFDAILNKENQEIIHLNPYTKKAINLVTFDNQSNILSNKGYAQSIQWIEKHINLDKAINNIEIPSKDNHVENEDVFESKNDEIKDASIIKDDNEIHSNISNEELANEDVETEIQTNLKTFNDLWAKLDLSNPNEGIINDLYSLYDDFNEEECKIPEIADKYNKLVFHTIDCLKAPSVKDKIIAKHNIYIARKIKDELPIKDKVFNILIEKMKELNTFDLMMYLKSQKCLVKLFDVYKIRIHIHKVERLCFVFGNKIGKESNDIYIFDYIKDHNFDHLKDVDFSQIVFDKLEDEIKLDDNQLQLAQAFHSPYKPLICTGCAGSGKTLISVEMYSNIVEEYYSNAEYTAKDLCYITYNENCLKSVKPLIIKRCPLAYAFSIKQFFIDILYENKDENYKNAILKNYVDELHFFKWWNKNDALDFLSDHKLKEKLNTYKNKTDSRYAYTFFRGYFKGKLSEDKSTLSNYLSFEEFDKVISKKEEPISFNKDDLHSLYQLFEIYQGLLEEQNLFDDNDLARQIINGSNKGLLSKFGRLIIDEVQDLTEAQLDAIIKCSKDKLKLYFFGDQNQSINPTLFDVNTIEKCFKDNDVEESIVPDKLNMSYRFGPLLANYMNSLKTLINNYIGSTGSIDEMSCLDLEDSKWGAKTQDDNLKEELLLNSINNAHQMIIVPDNKVKDKLVKKYGQEISNKITSIYDSKGLEWNSVILYDMISFNKDKYEDIFNNLAKKSTLHRMIFNQYYVGVTRARDSFIVIEEDDISEQINNNLLLPLTNIDKESINFYSSESNGISEWLYEGKKMFDIGQYQYAFNAFAKAVTLNINGIDPDTVEEINTYSRVCDYMLKDTQTLEMAIYCYTHRFYNEAKEIYLKLGKHNLANLMRCYLGEKLLDKDYKQLVDNLDLNDEELNTINKFGYLDNISKSIEQSINKLSLILEDTRNGK